MSFRIGITQRVMDIADRGERRDALDQRWARVISQLGGFPVPLCNSVEDVPGYVRALHLSGVILSGGNDLADLDGARDTAPERDRFEDRLLGACVEFGIPAVGVCRGMQMMNHHFGGRLRRLKGHAGGRHAIHIGGEVRDVNSSHSWGIEPPDLASDLSAEAMAQDGTIEAFTHRRLACGAIMWHPEREPRLAKTDEEFLRRVLLLSGGGS
jgi:gamma-glutamyl-gamma-aminobutyrate hydrolase PuuD